MSAYVGTVQPSVEFPVLVRARDMASIGIRAAAGEMLETAARVERNYQQDPQPELLAQLPAAAAYVALGRYLRTGSRG